jgi:hypothetical protein
MNMRIELNITGKIKEQKINSKITRTNFFNTGTNNCTSGNKKEVNHTEQKVKEMVNKNRKKHIKNSLYHNVD